MPETAEQRYEKAVKALKDHDDDVKIFMGLCLYSLGLIIVVAIGSAIFG